ncbi:MAG: matrixin family metalloprotease [Planctomycetaceae bacterium]|nr:matrixin family metalloprotease [Planctomycetaceae bacterium]
MTTWATMVRRLVSRIRHTQRTISGRTLRRRLMPPSVTTVLEVLENRALLVSSLGVDATTDVTLLGNDLVVTDASNGGQIDRLTLQSDAANSQVVIFDPQQHLSTRGIAGAVVSDDRHTVWVPFNSVAGIIRVDTLGGDDNLTIDYTLGTFSKEISFNGGTQSSTVGDCLTLVGGTFAAGTFSFTDDSAGSIDLSGNAPISYRGLEPIDTTATTIDDLVFTYGGGAETIALTDAGGNTLTIDSSLGESVTFANPGSSLTINAGSGDDIVNVTSVNAAFEAALTVNGGADNDTVNLDTGITFAPGRNLDVDLQNDVGAPGTDAIHVGAGAHYLLSGTGSARLTASGNVALAIGSSVVTVDGDLTIEANQQALPTLFSSIGVDVNNALIQSSGTGQVAVRGRGGDQSGGFQYGVLLSNGGIIAGGTTGWLSVEGTAGAGTGYFNYGVLLADTGSTITSSGADVSVAGIGGGTGDFGVNYGVAIQADAQITAGGAGTVAVAGIGSDTTSLFSSNYGVYVTDAGSSISSSGGNVLIAGIGGGTGGGTGEFSSNYGVSVQAAARIAAGGGGTVSVAGIGSGTTGDYSSNYGVYVADLNSIISSGGGDVSITGAGGGSGESSSNYGIAVQAGAQINAGDAGTVSVVGTGGDAARYGSSNFGVYATDPGSRISSDGGDVSVQGSGGGTGDYSSNYGVSVLAAAQIAAGNHGALTVDGIGGDQATVGSTNFGVYVADDGSSISSGGGDVSVTGIGGGIGEFSSNYGVAIQAAAHIAAGGGGAVAIAGIGGNTTDSWSSNFGVFVRDSSINSGGGDVSVTGVGGATGASSFNFGVLVQAAAQITAGATGAVTVSGTGGNTTDSESSNYGVLVTDSNAIIDSSGGDVSVTGTAGGEGSSFNYGIAVQSSGQIAAGGDGTVAVEGTGGNTTDPSSANYGVFVTDSNSLVTSGGGAVSVKGIEGGGSFGIAIVVENSGAIDTAANGGAATLIGNSMHFDNTATISASGNSSVTLRQFTDIVPIDLGTTTDTTGGPLGLSDAELDRVTAGTINIGDTNSGTITVSADIAHPPGADVQIVGGGDIVISGGQFNTGGGTLLLHSGPGTAAVRPIHSGVDVIASRVSIGGNLAIVINGPTVDTQFTQLNVEGEVNLTGAGLVLSGSYKPTAANSFIIVKNDGTDAVIGTFNGLPERTVVVVKGVQKLTTYVGGDDNDVALNLLGAPKITLTAPDVVYNGSQYTAAVATMKGITNVPSSTLEEVGLAYTYYVGSTVTGTPIDAPINAGTYTVVASFEGSVSYLAASSAPAIFHILKADATVVVTPYNVTYDGSPHTATVTSIAGVNGETGATVGSVTLDTTHTNAGTYSSDTWSFTGGANYNDIAATTITDTINKADATVVVTPYNVTYDGSPHTATVTSITGVNGETGATVGSVTLNTTHTNAGTYSNDTWSFTGGNNYNDASGTVIDTIAKADAVIVVNPYSVTYDATAHTATGTAKGVLNEDLSGLVLTGTTHTNAGIYSSDPWTFTDTTGNYNDASGTVIDTIAKADAVIVVNPYSVTYDATAHTATGTAKGVLNEDLSGLDLTGTTHTNAGIYSTDPWTFTDTTGNYNDAGGTVIDTIAKADAVIVVNPYSVTYDATAHTATGTAKGVLNEDLSGLVLTGTTHTNAGIYSTDPWTFTDTTGNYNDASGTVIDTIAKADAVIVVNPYSVTYDAAAHTATGTAKGVLNEDLSGLDLTGTTHTNAGTYSSDPWTFTDTTGNYNDASGTVIDTIAKANPTIVVTPYNVLYDAAPHTATGTAKGVLNESLSGLVLTGTTHTNVGIYATDPWTFNDTTGNYNNAGGTVLDRIVKPASLSGYVYDDENNDGLRTGDVAIAGVTVTLTGTNDLGASVSVVKTTNGSGLFQFSGLRPGTYALTETQPVRYLDGQDTIGTPGGTTTNDMFSAIVLNEGVNGAENNFGEIGATINGMKYLDVTGNGLSSDDTPLAGATFRLFVDANGNNTLDSGDGAALSSTISTCDGTFSFGSLPQGVYFVQEVAMSGYVRTGPTLTDYYTVNAQAGSGNGVYKFANAKLGCDCAIDTSSIKFYINGSATPVTDLRGKVNSGDNVEVRFNVTEVGATFSLVSYTAPGASFDANTAYLQTFFDTDTITNAPLGTRSLKVLVPNSYFQVDFVCGLPIDKFGPAGSNIFYTPQGRLFSADNDGSQPYAASTLSGYVYRDSDNDGCKDSGEKAIANVTLTLTGKDINGNSVSATVKTNSSGYYVFNNLKASDLAGYKISETQPSGYNDGKDTIGSLGGTVVNDKLTTYQLNSNKTGLNYNFGERPYSQITVGGTVAEEESTPLESGHHLLTGEIQVAVDGLEGDQAVAQLARINDAIGMLNAQMASFDVYFVLVSSGVAEAQVHLQLADSSELGGVAQGVLGVTNGAEITLINGWNWHVGADSTSITTSQFDFQTVVIHELGHVLGMGHSTDASSVMFAELATGQVRRTLSAADLMLIGEEAADEGPEALMAAAPAVPDAAIPQPAVFAARFVAPPTAQPALVPSNAGQILIAPDAGIGRDLRGIWETMRSTRTANPPADGPAGRAKEPAGQVTSLTETFPQGLGTAQLDVFFRRLGTGQFQVALSDRGFEIVG